MPPLLEEDPDSASSSSAAGASAAASAPPASFFAFQSARVRCVPDYSCCLRYALALAPCCMSASAAAASRAACSSSSSPSLLPSPQWLQSRFYPLHADEATLAFLHDCDRNFFERGWGSLWGLKIGILKPILRRCMAHTDVNGFLGVGQMFLTSREQCRIVLQQSIAESIRGKEGVEWPWSVPVGSSSSSASSSQPRRRARLLDVGAGDGHITSHLSAFFDEVVTTEVAPQMVKRLKARGYECVHTADLDEGLPMGSAIVAEGFDTIALFNVLDRCSKPQTLLRQILARMRRPTEGSGGVNSSRLILSVPLPLDPSVEVGTRWLDPEESILSSARVRACRDFESSVCALAEMLLGVGFNIESVSRLPYLSQGDTHRPFYVLDCSLWVLSARLPGEPLPKDDPGFASTHKHAPHPKDVPFKWSTDLTSEVD